MATLCLPNATLDVGVSWDEAALLRLAGPGAPPLVLLYPGDGAEDVFTAPPEGPVTLVVVDGTWWQARKLVRSNPAVARLPRYAFAPETPSEYRIRKEPNVEFVSTIEALMHALSALEGEPERFRALLHPFRAMVDAQLACEGDLRRKRTRHPKKPKKPSFRMPEWLVEREGDLVCLHGEANAWPYGSEERERCPEEIVHVTAVRVATGETFEAIARPIHPLSPSTSSHVELTTERILAGVSKQDLHRQLEAFLRPGDVVCSWGRYATRLVAQEGGALPRARLDLRHLARFLARGKVGSIEECVESLDDVTPGPSLGSGRAGRRLGLLGSICRAFSAEAKRERAEAASAV